MSILAIGTVAFDSIETPFGSAPRVLGGSATYITLAARFFSEDVRLVGIVGRDFPEGYVSLLRERGIDLSGLEVDPDGDTFFWAGRYHFDLNNRDTLATHLNVLANFDPTVPDQYRDSRVVCLGNLDPTIQRRVLEQMKAPEFVICDTMNFWIENTPDALRETLPLVDCLIINDSEARELSGEPNLIRAARAVREMGPKVLIIKKGEHGALLFVDDHVFSAPAFPLEDIYDPTGAGDTFAGGFAGFLAQQGRYDAESLKGAVIYGSALASFTVERFGPERLLDLTGHAINERVQAFRSLSAIPELAPIRGVWQSSVA
ncbi:MAG TPA: PfkB family carbohydrate kinase [Rhodothermales bacterium]|nr:PfkB family carbohydrate kinase [Rhodothermales bacterium]